MKEMVPYQYITLDNNQKNTVMSYYVDMHCHPANKPFSWFIFYRNNARKRRNKKTTLSYYDPPTGLDRILNKIVGVSKFTQSDITTLAKGNVKIISACLNPIERGLIITQRPIERAGPNIIKFVIEFSLKFIKRLKKEGRNYFAELEAEYLFYKCEETFQDPNGPNRFCLTNNINDIKSNLDDTEKNTVSVFFSIEGCHVFNNGGLESESWSWKVIEENIQKVKEWDHPPLYVSIAHHMENGLCGHAKSLPSFLGGIIVQNSGLNKGFTRKGESVLHKLLEDKPRRIYIDVKHMSTNSRIRYYEILDSEKYKNEPIPVIVSHGAVNGLESIDPKFEAFNTEDINIYNDEIIRIHCSGGFLGIQLDERRLCPITEKRYKRWRITRKKQLDCHSEVVWNQIYHIAKVLDEKGLFGWGTATIGSDYDGLVDSLNGYWTSEDFGILEKYLIKHAREFFKTNPTFQNPENGSLSPEKIIDLFMHGNADRFLEDFYTDDVSYVKTPQQKALCKEAGMTH